MNRTLVLVYRTPSSGDVAAIIGSWGSRLEAEAWLARAEVLNPKLRGRTTIIEMTGARQIKDVVEALPESDDAAESAA